MKIAIVRGPSLNPWEMQNYFPLAKKHELLLVGSTRGHYEFPPEAKIKRLVCLGEISSFIPKGIEFLYHFFGDPQIIWGLEKAVAGFDVVHTAECANYYSFQALKARRRGLIKKLVVTCWENIPGLHEDYPAQRRIKKEVTRGADHFLAVTNQAKEALLTDGAPEEKITVIPMGVDLNKFKPKSKIHNNSHAEFISASKSEGILKQVQDDRSQRSTFTILFVGRLVEEKGVWELLEAFRLLCRKENPHLKLRMVGSGPLYNEILWRVEEWGLSEKVEVEKKPYSQMPAVYQAADLLVLPSKPRTMVVRGKPKKDWQEQFGMVLVEAMACGLPVVTTESGAISEVVGGSGILVTPGNASELSETIIKVLKDEKLRDDLSVKGRQRAEVKYDCRKAAFKIEKLYREVIGG